MSEQNLRILKAARFYAHPGNWPGLAARVARNPGFFADLLEYAGAEPSSRRGALQRIVKHLYLRAFQADSLDWRSSTKGFPSTLLENEPWISTQLKATEHFGALDVVGPMTASRFDYAMLINAQLLRFKQEFAGYGLGTKSAPECSAPSGRQLTKLEVAQSWALLTNAGHLFGTFATERALLFELFSSPQKLREFEECIDPQLRVQAIRLLNSGNLRHAYYALACWRITRVAMDEDTRADCVSLLKAFLVYGQETRFPSHVWAFRAARQLAYHRLHLYLGVGHPFAAVHEDASVRAMSPWINLGFEPQLVNESSLFSKMLRHVDAYQTENHFSGTDAAKDVLCQVRSFRRWWRTKDRDNNWQAAVDSLFGQMPDDWQSVDKLELEHFARVKLPDAGGGWQTEVARWLNDDAAGAWKHANFLVTSQQEAGFICDVYTRAGSTPEPLALLQCAKQLGRHCEASWQKQPDAHSRELWRSVASFGLRVLSLMTRDQVRPILRPEQLADVPETEGHVAYGLVSNTAQSGILRARALLAHIDNADHRRELHAALQVAEETATQFQAEPMLLFLGSVLLVEAKRSQVERAEFDGVWCFFGRTHATWYLLEHKRAESGDRDLVKKLEFFRDSSTPYNVRREDVRGKVSVATVRYGVVINRI